MSHSVMEPPEFADLLRRAAEGDREAQTQLVQRCYPDVQRMVHRSLATDWRANRPWLTALFSTGDVVQEVLIQVVRDLPAVEERHEPAFTKYLATLVRNRLLDAVRYHEAARRDARRGVCTLTDETPIEAGALGPVQVAENAEQVDAFERALQKLTPGVRELLKARLEREMPFAQIADDLGYPSAGAARKAFYKAQAELVVRLQQVDGASGPGGAR